LSTGTSTKLFLIVSKYVPPGGIEGAAMIAVLRDCGEVVRGREFAQQQEVQTVDVCVWDR
jgi:hypothetical protein